MDDILCSINNRLGILEDMNRRIALLEARIKPQGEYPLGKVAEITGKSEYSLRKHCRLGTLEGGHKVNGKWVVPQSAVDYILTYGLPAIAN